ncbi:hypothetical protein GCM10010492_72250 [Saccharothrix mutabilis subsp. mutabilis]|uniref:Uncharacterized protein n=1 Tax=Saccharothrix mutabilis subsp. mutabilis TaxID=66855 RepID=A0ABP3EHQ9_9PSEU
MRRKALVVVAACLLVAVVAVLRGHTPPPTAAQPPGATGSPTATAPPTTARPGPVPYTRTPAGGLAERVAVVGEWLTVPSTPDASTVDTGGHDVERCGAHFYWPSEGKLARWAPGSPRVEVLDLPDPGAFVAHRCVYGILNVVTDQGAPRLWFLGAP